MKQLLYSYYSRRISRWLVGKEIPRHVGVILDGNRRWARASGTSFITGWRAGAAKIPDFLGWCEDLGVQIVTLWLLSTDNLARPKEQLEPLLQTIVDVVQELKASQRWKINIVGSLELLPKPVAEALQQAQGGSGMTVNIAVGYGGRQEITDAVRSLIREYEQAGRTLAELAENISVAEIARHLYIKDQPDPDLVIRTSGEQRLSGFLLWQSAHAEFYFADAYWPAFRKIDLLRAMRSYAQRSRRFGS